jgi:hypothetical protein
VTLFEKTSQEHQGYISLLHLWIFLLSTEPRGREGEAEKVRPRELRYSQYIDCALTHGGGFSAVHHHLAVLVRVVLVYQESKCAYWILVRA